MGVCYWEVFNVKWSDIDLENRMWVIFVINFKLKCIKLVFLNSVVIEVLVEMEVYLKYEDIWIN